MNIYHDNCFTILMILTAFSVVIWGVATVASKDIFISIMVALLLFIGVGGMGWGAIGNAHHVFDVTVQVDAKVVHTSESVILTVNGTPIKTLYSKPELLYFSNTNITTIPIVYSGYADIYGETNWSGNLNIKY